MSTKTKAKGQALVMQTPEGKAFTIEIETITPEVATEYLALNRRNRKVNKRSVSIYQRDMEGGAWRFTADGITFSDAGDLLNGQHRLLAIVAAGVAVPMMVFRGLPAATQEAIDAGMGRSVAENLTMIDGTAHAQRLCAHVRSIARSMFGARLRLSITQTRAAVKLLTFLPELATVDVARLPQAFRANVFLACIGLALHLPSKKKALKATEFFDAFTRGMGLTATHPATHLRNYALRGLSWNQGDIMREAFHFTADCLEAWIVDGDMKSAKPTKTGMDWIRAEMPELVTELRNIFRECDGRRMKQ